MPYKDPEKRKEYNRKYWQQYRSTPRGRAKNMVHNFRRNDAKYNRGECTITPEWIMENIFTSKCIYCGETDFLKLGCDRIDNTKPHTPDNVVCACWDCNNKRNNISFDKFVAECKEAGEIVTKRDRKDQSKPVVTKDPITLKVVYEFASIQEAARNGYNQGAVWCCCRGCYLRDGNHQYKGLLWYYKE